MKHVINLTGQSKLKFDKVKCEYLIEKVALDALKSMSYTVAPLSAMQEHTDDALRKAA